MRVLDDIIECELIPELDSDFQLLCNMLYKFYHANFLVVCIYL